MFHVEFHIFSHYVSCCFVLCLMVCLLLCFIPCKLQQKKCKLWDYNKQYSWLHNRILVNLSTVIHSSSLFLHSLCRTERQRALFTDTVNFGGYTASTVYEWDWNNGGMTLTLGNRSTRRGTCPNVIVDTTNHVRTGKRDRIEAPELRGRQVVACNVSRSFLS